MEDNSEPIFRTLENSGTSRTQLPPVHPRSSLTYPSSQVEPVTSPRGRVALSLRPSRKPPPKEVVSSTSSLPTSFEVVAKTESPLVTSASPHSMSSSLRCCKGWPVPWSSRDVRNILKSFSKTSVASKYHKMRSSSEERLRSPNLNRRSWLRCLSLSELRDQGQCSPAKE